LLLRGAQTEGELRGRAARMEPIADLAALRPVLAALKARGLVVSLSPEGRGHVVTHALYQSAEMDALQASYAAGPGPLRHEPPAARGAATRDSTGTAWIAELRHEIADLRAQLIRLRDEIDALRSRSP
jgi:uncharacterized protein YceH (UPF0502 family)